MSLEAVNTERVLRIAFVLAVLVAFAAAASLGYVNHRYRDDVLAGRPVETLFEVRSLLDAVREVALLGGALSLAIVWFDRVRRPHTDSRRLPISGLVVACAGVSLGIVTAVWFGVGSSPSNLEEWTLWVWIGSIAAFAWPLTLLGLGLVTFPRSQT